MDKWEWLIDTFTIIGMIVCIIVTLIALVWAVCFAVKLLIKIFNVKVGASYDIMVEDIKKKAEAKKARKEIKRTKQAARKLEILNMKEDSKDKVHEMKKQKLIEKLGNREDNKAKHLIKEDVINKEEPEKTKKEKKVKEKAKQEISQKNEEDKE